MYNNDEIFKNLNLFKNLLNQKQFYSSHVNKTNSSNFRMEAIKTYLDILRMKQENFPSLKQLGYGYIKSIIIEILIHF